MNKGFNRKRSRYHSHKIDKFLLQEYEHRKKEIQLLLIGLPNSGKIHSVNNYVYISVTVFQHHFVLT
ncbi:unnamed protein product [Heterobilharzia americana]|nr:unnamed protein product [Heterobilharzia americana]